MAPCKRLVAAMAATALAISLAAAVLVAIKIRVSIGYLPSGKVEYSRWWSSYSYRLRLNKCCRLGEQLDPSLHCMPKPGLSVSEKEFEIKVISNTTDFYYWVPEYFHNRTTDLFYGFKSINFHEPLKDSRVIYKKEFNSYIFLRDGSFRDPRSGNYLHTSSFCFDFLEKREIVLLFFPCSNGECFLKCCQAHQHMRRTPTGAECAGNNSPGGPMRDLFGDMEVADTTFQRCSHGTFELMDRASYRREDIKHLATPQLDLPPQKNFFDQEICVDSLLQDGGEEELGLAACSTYIGGWRVLWHLSQPSCWVAALLLSLALAAVARQPALRSTNHGRALASHAASLLLLNVLQIYFRYIVQLPKAWQTDGRGSHFWLLSPHCRIVAYLIYFCAHSANCWLTALCVNMAIGLRRMQRAPATATRGRGGGSGEWGLFALYCSFGWGAPLALAALTVYVLEMAVMRRGNFIEWALSFIVPNLAETRTSFFDRDLHMGLQLFGNGTFYYYFLPAVIVLVINLGLFVYMFLLIRRAKRETDILRRPETGRANAARDSAWVYVRLLLTTGVLEIAVEIVSWLNTKDISHAEIFSWEELRQLTSQYEAPLNIIDVIRSVVTFG